MKHLTWTLRAWILGVALLMVGPAVADTIVSVTDVTYDAALRPICTAVRMNPANFGAGVSNACALQTAGTYGPDRITYNVLDAAGQVTEVDQAYGVTTANGFPPTQAVQRAYARYYYNPNGTILYQVDADNNTTQYAYDGFDRLQIIYYPCPSTQYCANGNDYEQFQYDSNGNKTVWRRRNGKTLYYNYDALNREILHYVSDGSVPNVYTGYDLQGRVLYARYVSPSGSGITNIYDGLGRLTQTQDMNNRNVWYGYDEPTSVPGWFVYPDGNYIGYNLDAASRLVNAYWNGTAVLFQQSYDVLGRRVWLGKGAGNAGGQMGLGYDNLGRLTGLTNDLNGTAFDVSWAFTYGPSGQIVTTNDSSTVYDYKETTASTVNNAYDDLNRDAAVAAISGGYDANGNLGNDGTRLFYYDVYNHLTGVGSSAYPQNGPYLTFTYDPLGRLASQTYYGTTTSFLYDGTNLVGEYDGSGNMLERYVHGDGVDEPLVWFHGSGTSDERFFVQDYHGSVIGYTDATGNLDALYKYGPYGEPKDIGNATDFAGARFRYTGQTVIPEAGLYYYKARVYDPIFGRFLQTDPIGSKDDLDLYAYTGDDPIDKTDPTGNDGWSDFWNRMATDGGKAFNAGVKSFGNFAQSSAMGFGNALQAGGNSLQNVAMGKGTATDTYNIGKAGSLALGMAMDPGGQGKGELSRGDVVGKAGGVFSSETNAAGGTVWTSKGTIYQSDFTGIVNNALYKGDTVDILSGAHGSADGTMKYDPSLLKEDTAMFRGLPGVTVHDTASMTPGQISNVMSGKGTVIGGFCNSGACLPPYK